ncbi:hypothetical protein LTR56_001384 [Elasticomyces elasticus]|nr:hypothetical protein LTR56_001384 [Elasticomyces elasticus]KAK3668691.1 hypothetical protein LTR22_000579 [Elasticomyces elasticus]KAK4932043.1 hypothetical protein LTR49_001731 [Elasticomyces elasticus]KAK5768425.1 hypothetical protein LTS12_001212 [Elasticomyces elasticus]
MADAGGNEAYAAAVRAAEHEHYEALLGGVQKASSELQQLKIAHNQLNAAFRLDETKPETVQSTLDSMGEAVIAMSRLLTACTEHRMEVWKPTEKSAQSAQRVFGIPELCELIFTYLVRGQDLLHASQVNQATAAVARGSARIQRVLGFAPDSSGFWHSPFASRTFVGFQCDVQFPYHHDPMLPTVTVCFGPSYDHNDTKAKSELGIYISEYGSTNRGHSQPPPPKRIRPISNSDGITVGDIYDATLLMRDEHRLWPSYSLDEEGLVHPNILFEGMIELDEHDPLMVAKPDAVAKSCREILAEAGIKEDAGLREHAYTRAKVNALNTGISIPTLAEYIASKDFWMALEESEVNKEYDSDWDV